MRILAVVHHEVAGLGVFGDAIAARGHEVEEWLPAAGPRPRPLAGYDALLALGGGMNVDQEERYPWLREATETLAEAVSAELPTLGLCLGGQVLARVAGGRVGPAERAECGWSAVELTGAARSDPLFAGRPPRLEVFQWHAYGFALPPGAMPLARNEAGLQAFRIGAAAWGVQWHPEVTAESVLLWAERHQPSVDGAPVPVDLVGLTAQVRARIGRTNAEGRELCGRFLAFAEGRAGPRELAS
jgi:GMP synthase (glutamine-hydrolysing)